MLPVVDPLVTTDRRLLMLTVNSCPLDHPVVDLRQVDSLPRAPHLNTILLMHQVTLDPVVCTLTGCE